MAASRFDCHNSADIDAKKSSMTKSLYRFCAGYTGWYDLSGFYISRAEGDLSIYRSKSKSCLTREH